jgi:hypothetical protein
MAPKLPPPANTKAVFTRPSWVDADKAVPSRIDASITLARRSSEFIAGRETLHHQ